MEEKSLFILEFDKILNRLSQKAVMSVSSEILSKITPYTDINRVNRLLSETDEARRLTVKYGTLPLSPITDVRPFVKRSNKNAQLSCSELLNIAHSLRISREIIRYADIRDFENDYPLINSCTSKIVSLKETEQQIFSAIISEEELDDNASPLLASIRRKKTMLSNSVRDVLNDIIHSQNYASALQDAIITMRDGRYVVPVKAENKALIKGVVHDTSQTGATLFIEPIKVVEINNQIQKLASEEKEEIDRILSELTAEVSENSHEIIVNFNAMITLDVIFAKANLAEEMNASRPILNDRGVINIKSARHPLIKSKKPVPINIRLGEDFDTLVITGPNTGGKTVSLKTLGLFTLMTQAGLHIPANDGSQMAVFEHVFADIGDEQSIEQSLSTFSSHMINIVNIIKQVNYKSLVLLDELGAGTDPTEGAALATAILKDIASKGAKIAATTHYSEIKMYALSTERVENAACEFDTQTLCPTYRLLIGALGKSNAFAIASHLGVPNNIIENAKKHITAENTKFEDIVNKIESMEQKADKDREEAEKNLIESARIKKELEQKTDNIDDKKAKILDNARREARDIINHAKKEIDEKLKEIEKASKDEKAKLLKKAKQNLSQKISGLDNDLYDNTVKIVKKHAKPSDIKLGTYVLVEAMNQKGHVTKLPDQDGNMEVMVGILKVKTHISTVSLINDDNEKKDIKKYKNTSTSRSMNIKTEVDVRGMALDEALLEVDRYIDDAVLANISPVTIIHGKGTGILRNGLQDYLKSNRCVKSFRNGKYGEGENGVTIVEL